MFVSGLKLVRTLPCLAEPGKLVIDAEPSQPLDAVLPLLNAILPNVINYNPMAGTMTLRRQPGLITIYPNRVMITQVTDVAEGLTLLTAVRDLLNQAWERRDEIQPRPEGRRLPRPLDVYQQLPRTNCGRCGEATCMAFAFALMETRCRLEQCPPLAADPQGVPYQALSGMLGLADDPD
jgi:ArsR family metal-binding transcriptional regulator